MKNLMGLFFLWSSITISPMESFISMFTFFIQLVDGGMGALEILVIQFQQPIIIFLCPINGRCCNIILYTSKGTFLPRHFPVWDLSNTYKPNILYLHSQNVVEIVSLTFQII